MTQRTLPDQVGPGVKGERWIDLRFQEALAWRALRLPAKFPNSNRPNPRVPERQATSQEGRANDPGEAQRQVNRQDRGHRQRRQQTSPAAALPSPRGSYWGA